MALERERSKIGVSSGEYFIRAKWETRGRIGGKFARKKLLKTIYKIETHAKLRERCIAHPSYSYYT